MGLVRAAYCKSAIGGFKHAEQSELLLAGLDQLRAEVRAAGRSAWVNSDHYVTLADRSLEVLGIGGAEQFWEDRLLEAFVLPLLTPLVRAGTSMFGSIPPAIIGRTPQAYRLIYRGLGVPTFERDGEHHGVLTIDDVPPSFRTPGVATSFVGHGRAALRFVGAQGTVELLRDGVDEMPLSLAFEWR